MSGTLYSTKCTNCGHLIKSEALTEVDFTVCDKCDEVVPVESLYISSGPFFISRNDFVKGIDKYQKVLDDAYDLLEELKNPKTRAENEVTPDTVLKLIKNLNTLFEGSRLNVRVQDIHTPIEFSFMNVFYNGIIDNLSSTGVRIKFEKASIIQKKNYPVTLRFEDPKTYKKFILKGRVAWIDKNKQMGVKFLEMNEESRERLHEFIMDKIVNKEQ